MMTREDPILSNDDCGKRRRYIYIVYGCDLIVVGSEGEIYIDTKSYIGSSI